MTTAQLCSLDTLQAAQYGYLTGTAGTGKTTIARQLASDGRTVLAATTGIAAVNLGDCTTINSLLTYFDTKSLEEQFISGYLSMKLRKLHRSGIRRLVLDETSMLDANQLTILTKALEEAGGHGYVLGDDDTEISGDDDNEEPLGMILVGDFAQLAPVKAPYAFTSAHWPRYGEHMCILTDIKRQTDVGFVKALQAVRRGDRDQALAYFQPRLESHTDAYFPGTTILAKNEQVDRYNALRLDQLHTNIVEFPSRRWGEMRPEWGKETKPKHKWGIPHTLRLKEGCLVMLLANKRFPSEDGSPSLEFEYVNGDLGIFRDTDEHSAIVELYRGNTVRVDWVTRDNVIPLEVGRRKELKEKGREDLISGKHEIVGQVTYMPLRVAYASTVHKSQGLTLDNVQVNLRDHFFTQPGMLYVALSRARTPEGLKVIGTPTAFHDRVRVNEQVRAWL